MRVCFREAEPDAQPCVSILFAHEAFFPKLVEGPMCLHPLLAEFLVGKRPHRQTGRFVCLHISVAGGVPGADVEFRGPVFCVDAINAAGRAKLRLSRHEGEVVCPEPEGQRRRITLASQRLDAFVTERGIYTWK